MATFKQHHFRLLFVALATLSTTAHARIASLRCIDSHEDIQVNWDLISYTPESEYRYCNRQTECIVHPLLSTDGRDHFGFIVFKDYNNTSNQHLRWKQPSASSTSEYVYLRYYGYKYIGNSEWKVIGASAEDPSAGLLEPSRDRIWREGCFEMDHTSSQERAIYWDSDGYQSYEYLAVDKIIILALDGDETIACSKRDVSQIQNYCQDSLFPTTTTTTTTTQSTLPPPTEDPEVTAPPTEDVVALHCIDNDVDLRVDSLVSYEANIRIEACESDDCIKDRLQSPDGLDHKGFMVIRDVVTGGNGKQVGWEQPSSRTTSEYVYLRYYADNYPNNQHTKWGVIGVEDASKGSLDKTANRKWKEGCFKMDHLSSNRRYIQFDSGLPNMEYMALDKIIVLALGGDETIACNSSHVSQIKQYCQDIFPTPTTPTAPTTIITEAPPNPTTPTTPTPGEPGAEIEWVDTSSDLLNSAWSTSGSLRYAYETSEFPGELGQKLTSASGLFYFQGKPEDASGVQEISRSMSSTTGEAHLYMRYYIHHTSPTDAHQYFVSPVEGKFMGVHYLDATSDLRWKEAFLHLNAGDSQFAFQIGTTSDIEDQDFFIIDKIIFMQRNSD